MWFHRFCGISELHDDNLLLVSFSSSFNSFSIVFNLISILNVFYSAHFPNISTSFHIQKHFAFILGIIFIFVVSNILLLNVLFFVSTAYVIIGVINVVDISIFAFISVFVSPYFQSSMNFYFSPETYFSDKRKSILLEFYQFK